MLALAVLQRLAAFSSVRSDDSRRSHSFSRVSLTPNTIRSRIILSCRSPNSQDFARVFNSVINWSMVSPSCCLYSQNRYLSNTVFFLGFTYSSNFDFLKNIKLDTILFCDELERIVDFVRFFSDHMEKNRALSILVFVYLSRRFQNTGQNVGPTVSSYHEVS